MLKLVVAMLLAVAGCALGAELEEGCAALTACMESVQAEFDRCTAVAQDVDMDFLDSIIPEHKREKLECMKKVKEARDTKQELNRQREFDYRECLAKRADEVQPVKGKKAAKCQKALADFSAESSRVKRAASREERRQRRRQRNQLLDDAGLTLEDWKEMKQKRKALKRCKRQAKKLKKKCKPLTKCCSEAQICHLEYEVSETHDGIKSASSRIILQKRECSKGRDFDEIADEEVSADQILDNQLPAGDDA